MKKRRKKKPESLRLLRLTAVFLAIPLLARGAWGIAALLGNAGETAAMLSAALILPDGSAPLLRERFRAEIYNPDGENATGEPEQGTPLPEKKPEQQPSAPQQEPPETPSAPETEKPPVAPRIPKEFAAPIVSEDFSGGEGGMVFRSGKALIKNETQSSNDTIAELLETPWPVAFEQIDDPQVLLLHTHATEAFETYDSKVYDVRNTWRSTDNRSNMVAVGDAVARVLEERGVAVIHDTTQHDYPSYNGSYERSAETIRAYLEEYPSIKVVLDLHRDAMQREDAIIKPVATVNGKKAAQIMIISACDDEGADVPEWKENFRFASQLQNQLEAVAPGITRPVYLCYRKYNMDLTTGSLLVEFGSNANTLEEAAYSGELVGTALADLIDENLAGQSGDTKEKE